jgi:hypothetical protein
MPSYLPIHLVERTAWLASFRIPSSWWTHQVGLNRLNSTEIAWMPPLESQI